MGKQLGGYPLGRGDWMSNACKARDVTATSFGRDVTSVRKIHEGFVTSIDLQATRNLAEQ